VSLYLLRPGRPDDRAYVARTWVADYRSSTFAEWAGGSYYAGHNDSVTKCLDRSSVRVTVAHVPDDDSALLGFAVREGAVLHYVYVRADLRRLGIAKAMLGSDMTVRYTHRSQTRGCYPPQDWTFDPYLFFNQRS
jgi:GNAT superfamily N-acetyltransferase